jgi:hypothetical protein
MLSDLKAQIPSLDFPVTKQECWEMSLYQEARQPNFRADVMKRDASCVCSCVLN